MFSIETAVRQPQNRDTDLLLILILSLRVKKMSKTFWTRPQLNLSSSAGPSQTTSEVSP